MFPQYDFLFGLLIGIGILLALYVIFKAYKKFNLDNWTYNRIVVIMCYSGVAMYLGSRFFNNWFHTGNPFKGEGITYLGGLVSAVIVFTVLYLIFLRKEKKYLMRYLNIITLGFTLGHAVGRIGCFCAGCCYGKVTDSFIGVNFPKGSDAYIALTSLYSESAAQVLKVVPTQLIESVFLLVLFFTLLFINKYQFKIYLIAYGIFRYIIEFWRFDNRGNLGALAKWFTPSQLMSLICILAGIFLIIWDLVKKKKDPEYVIY